MKNARLISLFMCITFSGACYPQQHTALNELPIQCKSGCLNDQLSWTKLLHSTYLYVEIKRTGASHDMWDAICQLVDQEMPELKAHLIGSEADTISHIIKRGTMSVEQWDEVVASTIIRFQHLVELLKQNQCSGSHIEIILDHMTV